MALGRVGTTTNAEQQLASKRIKSFDGVAIAFPENFSEVGGGVT